ncbi:MAG: site-specific integrase, partial [Chloroflexota bacterium]
MATPTLQNTSAINSTTSLRYGIDGWKMFLEDQGRSIHTIKAFVADMNLLASYLPPDRAIGSVTTKEIDNFLNWMQSGRGIPCSPKTLARRITSIKSFFRWLNDNGTIVTDPAEDVLQKSVLSPLPQVLSEDEVQAVLNA